MKPIIFTLFFCLLIISCSSIEEENNPINSLTVEKKALPFYELCSVITQIDEFTYVSSFCDSSKSLYYYVVFFLEQNSMESVVIISSQPVPVLNVKGREIILANKI